MEIDNFKLAEAMNDKRTLKKRDIRHIEELLTKTLEDLAELKEIVKSQGKKEVKKTKSKKEVENGDIN